MGVTVTLNETTAKAAQALVASGRFDSLEAVVDAAIEALESDDAAWDALLADKVAEALADPRPDVPAAVAFAQIRQRIADDREA